MLYRVSTLASTTNAWNHAKFLQHFTFGQSSFLQVGKVQCDGEQYFILVLNSLSGGQRFNEIYFAVSVSLRVVAPVLGSIIVTSLLVVFVQKKKKLNQSLASQPSDKTKQMDDLTVCLVAVAFCFFLFVTPFAVISIMFYGRQTGCSFFRAFYIAVSSAILNSSANFFVYYWKLKPFRKAVKKLFVRNEVSDESTVTSNITRRT